MPGDISRAEQLARDIAFCEGPITAAPLLHWAEEARPFEAKDETCYLSAAEFNANSHSLRSKLKQALAQGATEQWYFKPKLADARVTRDPLTRGEKKVRSDAIDSADLDQLKFWLQVRHEIGDRFFQLNEREQTIIIDCFDHYGFEAGKIACDFVKKNHFDWDTLLHMRGLLKKYLAEFPRPQEALDQEIEALRLLKAFCQLKFDWTPMLTHGGPHWGLATWKRISKIFPASHFAPATMQALRHLDVEYWDERGLAIIARLPRAQITADLTAALKTLARVLSPDFTNNQKVALANLSVGCFTPEKIRQLAGLADLTTRLRPQASHVAALNRELLAPPRALTVATKAPETARYARLMPSPPRTAPARAQTATTSGATADKESKGLLAC